MASIFDILGPVMVGPSSSHTAGAVRIGLFGRKLFGRQPESVEVYLHGSFGATGRGHGTDRALIAGLLGMQPDDLRIPDSFQVAEEMGMKFEIKRKELRDAHPNTALLVMRADGKKTMELQAYSIGGGRIRVSRLDDIDVDFSGESHTLIIRNKDRVGCITEVGFVLSLHQINIATLNVFRNKRGGTAIMIVEVDQPVTPDIVEELAGRRDILQVIFLEANGAEQEEEK